MRLEINKNTSIPVYIQVANGLRNRIIDGVYTPGFRFPAESDFAAKLGINASVEPGLPGKYCPQSAAEALLRAIKRGGLLNERE